MVLVKNEFTSAGTLTENKYCEDKRVIGKKWEIKDSVKTNAERFRND